MAFLIPKIEYKNAATTGDTTSGSGTVANVADTSKILAGMFVKGSGIPTGTLVGTVSSTSFTLASSVHASATAAGVALAFGFAIALDYPPKEPKGEILESKSTISESLSGVRQTSVSSTEGFREFVFSFLSPAIYALFNTWLTTSALLGDSFRYFEDQTSSTYVEYSLDTLKVTPVKVTSRSATTYVWDIPLKFRRVL